MQVIPAIDLRGGRCVRLLQGDFSKETVFSLDPLLIACEWERQGAERLHLVDLDGAARGQPRHLDLLHQISRRITIPIQFGGGLRTSDDVHRAFETGAASVIVSTAALRHPAWLGQLLEQYPRRIIVSLDTRGDQIATGGWLEQEQQQLPELLQGLLAAGVKEIIHTSVERDGTMSGPDVVRLGQLLSQAFSVTAAGGISSLSDLLRLRELATAGLKGAIVGRALYEQRFTLGEAIALVGGGQHVG